MKRVATAALLTVALAAVALVAGVSGAPAVSGPRCADITHVGWNYATQGTINVGLVLNDAPDALNSTPCKSVTYTLAVSGVNNGPLVLTQKGNHLFEGVQFTDVDNNICISATTASSGGKVHDAAPDAGCLEVSVGTSGGKVGMG